MRAIRRFMGIAFLLVPLGTGTAAAQSWWALSYQPAAPLSNTQDFTDNFTWRGVGVDYKRMVKPNLTVGLSFGWHVFDEQTDDVVSAFGVDLSGDQFRYVNSFPLLANVSYFLGKQGGARPYLGANVGAYIMEHRLDVGLYSLQETNWHFGFAPEAGIAFPARENVSVLVNARYNYALSAGSVDDQTYLNFSVGLAWQHGYLTVTAPAIRPIESIFHPSDFSEGSEVAFAHALKIALVAGSRLDILHVAEGGGEPAWTDFPGVREMLERWQVLPPNSPREAVGSIGIDARKVVLKDSDPVRAVERFLQKHPTDLVVLAAHAHQGHMRWTRSSISRPIAQAAAAPALFVPYGCDGFISREDGEPALRNVLIPVDSAPGPEPALEAARRLAWALQCPEVTFTLLYVGRPDGMPAVRVEEQPGWTWRKVTREGDVVDTILAVARECSADLIVMTTAGRNGFLDALRGSTTERVLRSGAFPLLAIPANRM